MKPAGRSPNQPLGVDRSTVIDWIVAFLGAGGNRRRAASAATAHFWPDLEGVDRESRQALVRMWVHRDPALAEAREEGRAWRRRIAVALGRESVREDSGEVWTTRPRTKGGDSGRAYARALHRLKRQAVLEQLGDPTECGVCGVYLPDERLRCVDHRHDNDVVRGVVCTRCNAALGAIDLRYTDPDLWASLLAWSARGEPVVPTGRKRSDRRVLPADHPTLFKDRS